MVSTKPVYNVGIPIAYIMYVENSALKKYETRNTKKSTIEDWCKIIFLALRPALMYLRGSRLVNPKEKMSLETSKVAVSRKLKLL